MRQRLAELILPPLAAMCGLAIVLLSAGSPIRLIAGSALVLLLPGVAFARAVLPLRERAAELVVVALGGGISLVVFVALGLDVVGIRLKPAAWASVLVILTAVGCAVATLREVPAQPAGQRLRLPRSADTALIVASLALIAGAAVLGARPLSPPSGTPGSTALWIEGGARGAVAVAQSGKMSTARYKLSVTVDGRTVATSPGFSLAPGEQYRLPVPPPLSPKARVQAQLYRLDHGGSRFPRQVELSSGENVPLASVDAAP
jgi:hypothetical protein